MGQALFMLGARLRAAHTGSPVATAAYSPAIPPHAPIAVTVDTDGTCVYVTASDDMTIRAGAGRAGLDALASLGVRADAPRRSLIIGTPQELAVLTALARSHREAEASPVIGWWDERADHPGSDAVLVVTTSARRRWVLGVHPDQEEDIATWARWLGVARTGPGRLHDLAALITAGATLPGLLHASVLDSASWDRYAARLTAGRPWWAKDSRIDAALGLLSRSHATEWYESLRLDDPRVALGAAHAGSVVPGSVVACDATTLTLAADRPLSRLRVDSKVAAWRGEPTNAGGADCAAGTIAAAQIDSSGRLTLTIEALPRQARDIRHGDRLTVRPARVDPDMQTTARRLAVISYRRGTNWIAGRGKPQVRRGDVPLDVVAAAAEE